VTPAAKIHAPSTKPGDIPVEQPTKFDLVIYLDTCQGARADEVIE
jgi:hypothetical protein